MLTKLKVSLEVFREQMIKKYPITMALIVIASFFLAIVVEIDTEKYIWIARLTCILWTTAAGTLFCEEILAERERAKYIGCAISAVISIIFTMLMSYRGEFLFGIESERFSEEVLRFFVSYLAWILVISVCHMFKRSEKPFVEYCLRVCGGVVKTSIVYGIFALGILIIMVIFNELIYDTDDFVWRLEAFLAGCVYFPGVLLAVSDVEEDVSRFFKIVVKFVLMPLTIAAFVIIYLYIAKLLFTKGLPSNEVFPILTALFCVGLPIWTMACNFEDVVMGKVAKYMPYAFVPFIILQGICVGMRMSQYGLTEGRYMGCALITFECIYIALYFIKNSQFLPLIFYVAVTMVTLLTLIPFVRIDDAVYYSQKSALEKFLTMDAGSKQTLTNQQKKRLVGSYGKIKYDRRGKNYIDKISQSDKDWLQACGEEVDDYRFRDEQYINASLYHNPCNVAGYSVLSEFTNDYSDDNRGDLTNYKIIVGDREERYVNIAQYVEAARNENDSMSRSDMDNWLKEHNELVLADGSKLVINELSIHVNNGEIESMSIRGYYLEK